IHRTTGDWTNLAIATGAKISITGTADGSDVMNDGTYTVTGVSGADISAVRANLLIAYHTGDFTATVNVTQPAPLPASSATVNFGRNSAGDTITRTTGDWSVTTLEANAQISITGAGPNNGMYTIASVSGATITLKEHDVVKANIAPLSANFFQETIGGTTYNRIERTDGLDWVAATTFTVGSTITVTGTSSNNRTFTITATSADVLTVTEAVTSETGASSTFTAASLSKTFQQLNAHKPGSDVHSLIGVGQGPLKYTDVSGTHTVQDGATLFVVNPSGDPDNFGLSLTKGGTALTFVTTGLDTGASHTLRPIVDLSAGSGLQQLRIDLTGGPSVAGTQHITGVAGLPLGAALSLSGDGLSKAQSTGSGGGFVGIGTNEAHVTTEPSVIARIGTDTSPAAATLITAGSSVSITTSAKTNGSSSSRNDTGGFVGI